MLLSVSRRTDIPAFYADWFFQRMAAGFALVRNPMNPRQVARIRLCPEVIDGIVFWTKNPTPMLDRLHLLAPYPYYFQFTLTSYGQDIEPNVPGKGQAMLPAFQSLSGRLGPERVIWRYDPILLSGLYTEGYHLAYFERIARRLQGYTTTCTISFIDDYRTTRRNTTKLALKPIDGDTMRRLAASLSEIARAYGMSMNACAETLDLSPQGVGRAACVDAARIARIGGRPLRAGQDKNQRSACGCSESIDLGMYNTCLHGCLYCYANYDERKIPRNAAEHRQDSPLLVGEAGPEDRVYDRVVKSCVDGRE